jgi:hypothetical protein
MDETARVAGRIDETAVDKTKEKRTKKRKTRLVGTGKVD